MTSLNDYLYVSKTIPETPDVNRLELTEPSTVKTTASEIKFFKDGADTEDGEALGKITFYGKDSAKKDESKNKLVPLIVETNDIDVTNNEAVLKGDNSIGYITSGGFAHYVGKSIAFSYLDKNILKSNEKFQVEINRTFYNSLIIKEALYDPKGKKMRS